MKVNIDDKKVRVCTDFPGLSEQWALIFVPLCSDLCPRYPPFCLAFAMDMWMYKQAHTKTCVEGVRKRSSKTVWPPYTVTYPRLWVGVRSSVIVLLYSIEKACTVFLATRIPTAHRVRPPFCGWAPSSKNNNSWKVQLRQWRYGSRSPQDSRYRLSPQFRLPLAFCHSASGPDMKTSHVRTPNCEYSWDRSRVLPSMFPLLLRELGFERANEVKARHSQLSLLTRAFSPAFPEFREFSFPNVVLRDLGLHKCYS